MKVMMRDACGISFKITHHTTALVPKKQFMSLKIIFDLEFKKTAV
jgi:hypothetical protein